MRKYVDPDKKPKKLTAKELAEKAIKDAERSIRVKLLPHYDEWRPEWLTKDRLLKTGSRLLVRERHFKVHLKTLMEVVKSQSDLKLYCFYLNIHSIFKQKVILNYKSKFAFIKSKTNVSNKLIESHIKKLIAAKICWLDPKGKDLYIGSSLKFENYLNISDDYYNDFEYQNAHYLRVTTEENFTTYKLEKTALQIRLAQKAYGILNKEESLPGFGNNIIKSKLLLKEAKLKEYLANKSGDDFNLFLNDIKKLFGLNSNQAASYKINKLKEKGHLKVIQQFKYLEKVNSIDKRVSNNLFIKNGWLIKQIQNRLVFLNNDSDLYLKANEHLEIISDYQQTCQNIKALKIKTKRKESVATLSHKLFNKKSLKESKRKFRRLYISKETGEIIHEHIFYKVKDLVIRGWREYKIHITPRVKIREKYKVIEEEFDLNISVEVR
ncbi:MAG: hypothetical protein ABIP51_07885 [Bacteroidia bacterium]